MVRGLAFSDLCFEEKSGNIEFGFEFELDLPLDGKLDLELEFEFHIFHSDSHEFCKSLHGQGPLKWTISSYQFTMEKEIIHC